MLFFNVNLDGFDKRCKL